MLIDRKLRGMQIKTLDQSVTGRWDQFVATCEQATFFHRAGWQRVIEQSFAHRTYFLYAEEGRAIQGVLPLVHIKHPLFGNSLSSTAFCVYGGPATNSPAAAQALNDAAIKLAADLDVDHLEYRQIESATPTGFREKADLYVTFRKPIDADVERNMLAVPRKQRAMIRKGIKFGLTSEVDADASRLHRVYAESVRNLGTPVFSCRYFEELKREFGDACEILTIIHDGKPVAGVMNFYFRDEVLPYYGGGTAAARALAANDFMYWEVMRRACERGYRLFDFGRSKQGTGAFDFKKNWGFTPMPLRYQYLLRRGDRLPELNPSNPKYRLAIALWKRLPLPIANLLGPHIVRNLG
jgi:FemAB-related protein (PEP-CTERM system-associated)